MAESSCRKVYKEAPLMIVLDANYILRYLLKDNEQMYLDAKQTIENEACLVLGEVVAEVVYVLSGFYKVSREEIAGALGLFLEQGTLRMHESKSMTLEALNIFAQSKLDYVDCLLCALSSTYEIKSFDKGVKKCVKSV